MPNTNLFSNLTGNLESGQTAKSTGNMYNENVGKTNLRTLADLEDINNITSTANGLLNKSGITDLEKRSRYIEFFYNKVLLDTIKLGTENNVYLKYCKAQEVPAGNAKFTVRRWGGLTEHTFPLAEGIPPKSDRMASESFTGTFCQYGRYMEFTDRVEFNLIDDVIAHYSMELGDVAVRTAERLCREEMEFFSNPIYPDGKAGIDELMVGDTVGIEDYRLQALKFHRILVKPINGMYIVICSPEHIYDLVKDPLVENYMKWTQTAEPYKTGKPVDLFNIRFEETMLDDYAYGYTEMSNPGEYIASNKHYCRCVGLQDGAPFCYFNLVEDSQVTGGAGAKEKGNARCVLNDVHLKDGSAIPFLTKWTMPKDTAELKSLSSIVNITDTKGEALTLGGTEALTFIQLPIHKSFMFGAEHMIKTGISGRGGAKFYIKEKGSAGVLDPIDQRQSVGFKIDTLGFTCVRPEAIAQFIFVPKEALVTYTAVLDDWDKHYSDYNYAALNDGSVYDVIKNGHTAATEKSYTKTE